MRAFFTPARYRRGPIAIGLAGGYLTLAGFLIASAATESPEAGTAADGSFVYFLVLMITLPLSLFVAESYSAIESARGVSPSDQDGGLWLLVAFALCALVNALLIWVVLRGRRIPAGHAARRR